MGHRTLVLAVIAGLCSAALAVGAAVGDAPGVRAANGAVELLSPGGRLLGRPWQSWADASLMPTVTGRVVVRRARCPARPSAAGCVYTKHPRTIWLRPGLDNPRGVLLHELGHVYDLRVLNNRDRAHFRRIIGRTRAQWWRGRLPLAEQFAEAYSWCARYARIVSIARYSSYAYRPSGRQHKRICALIRAAARDGAPAHKPADVPVVTGPYPPPPPPPSTAPGTVPGDPHHDPGPQQPKPKPTPTPTPTPRPAPPVPVPVPTPTSTAWPIPTPRLP